MAPQLGQIESVGAKLRSQTGQFIGLMYYDSDSEQFVSKN